MIAKSQKARIETLEAAISDYRETLDAARDALCGMKLFNGAEELKMRDAAIREINAVLMRGGR